MERSDDASAAADGRQLGGAMYVYNSVALGTMERHKLPENPSEPDIVYRHIQELRLFDSNPRLNLASYVTTWMEDPARQLIMDSLAVNHVDGAIYASSNDIEARCISIMAALWHAPNPQNVMGCATVGSTEACLLGGLNMKKWWAQRRKEKGLATDKPNLIVCSCFQVCWEKFAKYWDVELRLGKLKEGSYTLTPEAVEELADENTIGVAAILGSTYTGDLDDVQALSAMSDKLREKKGLELPIHVDAASGGFVAPFLFPDLVWDFQLKNVMSISTSGHKYGLVYPGVGWALWRTPEALHPDMVFHCAYLGTDQTNLTLNFSRPASHIVASYYQLLRLGRSGFTQVNRNMQEVALHLAQGLRDMGVFRIWNDPAKTVPMVTFSFKPQPSPSGATDATDSTEAAQPTEQMRAYTEFDLADTLKQSGWSLPAYPLAPDLSHTTVCRAVVRQEFSITLADKLLEDLKRALQWLDKHFEGKTRADRDAQAAKTQELHPLHTHLPHAIHKHQHSRGRSAAKGQGHAHGHSHNDKRSHPVC